MSQLATQSSHCHAGTPKILFKGSPSELGSALVTFPVAMTKYLDKNNLWEKGQIFGSQFAGVVHWGGEVIVVGTASTVRKKLGSHLT